MSEPSLLEAMRGLRDQRKIAEDREHLPESYMDFIRDAWHTLKPHEPFIDNWHLQAIACHMEAISRSEIHRLQVWVPPSSMKTMAASVFWHPWEWTTRPWLRYWTASYGAEYAGRNALYAQEVIKSKWYQERWGDVFRLVTDAASHYRNDQGGDRLSTTPGRDEGTGIHGHRIVLDDIIPAKAGEIGAAVDLATKIKIANDWYDSTVSSRGIDNGQIGFRHARVLIMQRLHENDPAAHLMGDDEGEWTILALPERFWAGHPYAWRGENIHPAVKPHLPKLLQWGDPREEGQLLWPARYDEAASNERARSLGFRATGQLQQWPTAREGAILKRDWWRFYDPRHRGVAKELPKFSQIVISVDTPLKDKETSDNVAIQVWGVSGGDRYLLDLDLAKMSYPKAKRRIIEMSKWAKATWNCYHVCLIENAGYGHELITDLKREIGNVQGVSPGPLGDKITRAEAASDALESGNCFLPGYGKPWQPAYDEARTPADVAAFVHSLSTFPFAAHDDDVDAWSQAMNWIRARASVPMQVSQGWKSKVGLGVRR
jgi:predicted phage terminase large subunit-like protein